MNTKQVIVMRRDLKMPRGKIAAQASHASMACLLNLMDVYSESNISKKWSMSLKDSSATSQWLRGIFTKVCVSVDSEEELIAVYNAAKAAGLNVSKIVDNGLTCFNNQPTLTCIGIGPDFSDNIDPITKTLKLYN